MCWQESTSKRQTGTDFVNVRIVGTQPHQTARSLSTKALGNGADDSRNVNKAHDGCSCSQFSEEESRIKKWTVLQAAD
jgi:hypothetical protein